MSNENQSSITAIGICILLTCATNAIPKSQWEQIYYRKIAVFFPSQPLAAYKQGFEAGLITLSFYFDLLGDFDNCGVMQ